MRDKPAQARTKKDDPDDEAGGAGAGPAAAPGDEETYYDAMKREMGGREARTRAALDALDPQQRIAMEGFRPGAYLRLRFSGPPRCRPWLPLVRSLRIGHVAVQRCSKGMTERQQRMPSLATEMSALRELRSQPTSYLLSSVGL